MKAQLKPLRYKYYGTEIEVESSGGFEYVITLWNSGNFHPSPRELMEDESEQHWWEHHDGCDGHFESLETYNLAKELVGLINGRTK